jgi:hypothetical protein
MPSQHSERVKRLTKLVKQIRGMRKSGLNEVQIDQQIHKDLMYQYFYNQSTRQDYIDTAIEVINSEDEEAQKHEESDPLSPNVIN